MRMIILSAFMAAVACGEELVVQAPSDNRSEPSSAKLKPPSLPEFSQRVMLGLIKPLDSDATQLRNLSLAPEDVLRSSHLPRAHRAIETRIEQYEKAYRMQETMERLNSIGIDQTLLDQLCLDPEKLRSTIKALKSLSSIRDSKP